MDVWINVDARGPHRAAGRAGGLTVASTASDWCAEWGRGMRVTELKGSGWELVGKAAVVISALAALVTVATWWNTPSKKLEARIERGSLYWPPQVIAFHESVNRELSAEGVSNVWPTVRRDGDTSTSGKIPSEIYDYVFALRKALNVDVSNRLTMYHGYWRAEVVNKSEVALEDVVLRLPEASTVAVRREDKSELLEVHGPIINLGKIGAGQSVQVTAWTITPLMVGLGARRPTIHHAGGAGKVITDGSSSLSVWLQGLLFIFALIGFYVFFEYLIKPVIKKFLFGRVLGPRS